MKFKRAFLAEPGRFIIQEVEEVPGDNDVQIKVASCGLCNWELNHWKGYITDGGYPMPLGHESAGVITAVGKNVTRFKPGDKVSALYGPGAFAEYLTCDESVVVKKRRAAAKEPNTGNLRQFRQGIDHREYRPTGLQMSRRLIPEEGF